MAAALLWQAGCGARRGADRDVLTIGAFSVVREAFHEGIVPEFQAYWKAKTGRELEIRESYNSSGAMVRAIDAGLPADVVVLSHSEDMDALARSQRVRLDWDRSAKGGVVAGSIVVIGVRPGNPRHLKDWGDLARPKVGVLYPDPKTSGGAAWNINAIFGSALLARGTQSAGERELDEARRLVSLVQSNVINMDVSSRQSMANFLDRGLGDAIVTYENEIVLSQKAGHAIEYVVPRSTLRIENPAALVEDMVRKHGNREIAEAFIAFVQSDRGQGILEDFGFRPISGTSHKLPATSAKLFSMHDLGGWRRVKAQLNGYRLKALALAELRGARFR